jgi:hypothetical protein
MYPSAFRVELQKSPPSLKAKAGEGGERGIRTLDAVAHILPFQGSSFNHSDTSPWFIMIMGGKGKKI